MKTDTRPCERMTLRGLEELSTPPFPGQDCESLSPFFYPSVFKDFQ